MSSTSYDSYDEGDEHEVEAFDDNLNKACEQLDAIRTDEDLQTFRVEFDEFNDTNSSVDGVFYDLPTFRQLRKCSSAEFKGVLAMIITYDVDTDTDPVAVLYYDASEGSFSFKQG
jgi:hypothetical protein